MWSVMPVWLRTTLSLIVLGLGVLIAAGTALSRSSTEQLTLPDGSVVEVTPGGSRSDAAAFRVGGLMALVGAIMLLFSGKSKSEKSGYRF
jgi:hypothetical protein